MVEYIRREVTFIGVSVTVTEKPVSPVDVVRGSVISHSGTAML